MWYRNNEGFKSEGCPAQRSHFCPNVWFCLQDSKWCIKDSWDCRYRFYTGYMHDVIPDETFDDYLFAIGTLATPFWTFCQGYWMYKCSFTFHCTYRISNMFCVGHKWDDSDSSTYTVYFVFACMENQASVLRHCLSGHTVICHSLFLTSSSAMQFFFILCFGCGQDKTCKCSVHKFPEESDFFFCCVQSWC